MNAAAVDPSALSDMLRIGECTVTCTSREDRVTVHSPIRSM